MDPQTNSFFGELYTRYYLDLFRYAKSYVREDALAQEIVQEAFVILLTQQSTLEQHPNAAKNALPYRSRSWPPCPLRRMNRPCGTRCRAA